MISQRDRGELARFYTVTDPKKHQKGYTVYKVTARIISRKNPEDVQEIIAWKRYSDFRRLHQNLLQLHKNVCSQSELFPPFARAKVFGRFDDSVIEERRQCSEDLLQFSANIPALYGSQHIQDFFKGGDVHDGSELIGPAESLSDFLADSLSDCSSDVQRDISGAEDLTVTSDYGGPSSDSDLTSLPVDTDSLAGLDDGMASGCASPKQPHGGATSLSSSSSPRLPSLHDRRTLSPAPPPASSTPNPEVSWPGRSLLFPGSLRKVSSGNPKEVKPDYLDRASELISSAVQKEKEQDFQAAFTCYRSVVDLLLQGVQGEPSPTRREAVKKRTAEYLMRAEQISSRHLKDNMGQGSTQTVALGAQCCSSTSRGGQQSPSEELRSYRVLGVIDKVLLVMDKITQETFIVKGLRKSSDCGRLGRTVMPHAVPHMVQLKKFVVSEDTVFLLLQYAEGGKLWSHIGKYLRTSSPDDSFDIPFIQKSHTAAVHSPHNAPLRLDPGSASSGSGPAPASASAAALDSSPALRKEDENAGTSRRENVFPPGLVPQSGGRCDSVATSEEECTNSYLTLCNEYEQDKVEPDALEEEAVEDGEERSEQDVLSLEVPAVSSRSRSLLSNDSLSSPVSSQELSFAESSNRSGPNPGGEQHGGTAAQDQYEVFSPLPSPASPTAAAPLSLDQSKHTPMEFFRIDSKDSASEATCLDSSGKQPPVFSSSATGGSLLAELQPQEIRILELWGLDCSDKASNESVPVISFSEAVGEDEGPPPDLLVNLPAVGGAIRDQLEASSSADAAAAAASPQKLLQPDVLQLHSQPEEELQEELQEELEQDQELELEQEMSSLGVASAACDTSVASSSPFNSQWDDDSLALGEEASDRAPHAGGQNHELPLDPPAMEVLGQEEPEASAGADSAPGTRRTEEPEALPDLGSSSEFDKRVSRLFAELDELSLAASLVRLPEEFVRCWAAELVAALDALHREGVICRDLNPNNILLDHQGHVQLTYFCSWSDVEECCDKEALANMYCAPEVGGIGEETAACDWWSLGAILFELLIGTSLLRCHPAGIGRHTALNIPESVSEEARSLLEQLLQYNPLERLGAGAGGVDDIRSHPFFASVNWAK
ncbi:ribosomal protein S6 kinase delta-1 [Nelusetta ayraudi]|uniref:ribosomal protein S6 kinase delta-1 n=1 Tax=Nelusetta ayraudi TaxID=303726 RepID=UPI003F7306C9